MLAVLQLGYPIRHHNFDNDPKISVTDTPCGRQVRPTTTFAAVVTLSAPALLHIAFYMLQA